MKSPFNQKDTEDSTRSILLMLGVIFLMVMALSIYVIVHGQTPSQPFSHQFVATAQKGKTSVKANVKAKKAEPVPAAPILAPDFKLKNVSGKDVTLSSYKGKVVVLNFWATWCGPCNMETPWLVDLREQYHKQGFEIIGISVDSLDDYDPAEVSAFIKEHKVNYPIAMATKEVVNTFGPVSGLPTTIVIDRQGKIKYRHRGLISFDDLKEKVIKLL
jgi:peroxiredoxin